MNNEGLTLNQLAERNAVLVSEVEKLRAERDRLAAENTYLLNGAARELNTSWMFHKTMLGAQAALACLSLGRESAARDWLEGTTDEAGAEIPDDITVAGLQEWFDSQMISNDGKSGFLTRAEAEEAIRKACPATDRIYAGAKADGVEWIEGNEPAEFGRYWVRYETDIGPQYCSAQWMEYNFCASSDTNIHKIWLADYSRSINSLKGVTHYTKLPASLEDRQMREVAK